MEGDGPSAGKPRSIGALLISTDPYALDVVACSLIGLKPEIVPTIRAARERGYVSELSEVTLKGDDMSIWNIRDFTLPKSMSVDFADYVPIPKVMKDYLLSKMRPFPAFSPEVCIGCGDCAANCPPKVITMTNRRPQVELQSCIRCFCCHELCPHKAVDIKRPMLGKYLFR